MPMDNTWEAAFKKSAQVYFEEGDDDLKLHSVKPPRYNKKYFDAFEEERLGPKKAKDAKTKVVTPDADE